MQVAPLYVFMMRRVHGVDGNIQYVFNKKRFLERKGFRVFVWSAEKGRIVVDAMRPYEKAILPSLFFCPSIYPPRIREAELEHCLQMLPSRNDCIIESNTPVGSVWAEWAASRLQCRHLVFNLHERHDYRKDMREFFRFKLARHELFGITENSVPLMLGEETGRVSPETRIRALCTNSIDDVADNTSPLLDPHADYTIGSIGRLEKGCVPAILDGIGRFVASMPGKKFNVVLIGGCRGRKLERSIRHRFDGVSNVRFVMTGNMYPIPDALVRNIDVFVSTAGAAKATYRRGRPTITVHPLSGEVVGVLGLDLMPQERSMYSASSTLTLPTALHRVLLDRPVIQYPPSDREAYQRIMDTEFERQLAFAGEKTAKEYYPEEKLLRIGTPFLHHPGIVRALVRVFGIRTFKTMERFLQG